MVQTKIKNHLACHEVSEKIKTRTFKKNHRTILSAYLSSRDPSKSFSQNESRSSLQLPQPVLPLPRQTLICLSTKGDYLNLTKGTIRALGNQKRCLNNQNRRSLVGSGYTQGLFIVKNQDFFKFKYTYLSPLISKISRIIQSKYHKIAVLLPHHATFSNYIYLPTNLSVCMYTYIHT